MSLEDLLEDLEQTEKEIGQEETIDSSSGAGEGGAGTGGLFGSTTFTGSSAQSLADGFGQSGSGLFGDLEGFGSYVDETVKYIVPDTLEQLLIGIGQSEIEAIWADPTIEQILLANGIKMNPDAP